MRYVKPTEIQVETISSVLSENTISDVELLLEVPYELKSAIIDLIYDFDWQTEYLKQHYASYEEACENEADQRRCE